MWHARAHTKTLGWLLLLGAGAGVAVADPVPVRPPRPKQDPCRVQRGINPNGPDFTGTALTQNPSCPPLPQLLRVRLAAGVSLDGKTLIKDFTLVNGELKSASQPAASLVGALLLGDAEGMANQAVRLRIGSVETAADPDPKTPTNENADVRMYRVAAQLGAGRDPTDERFRPNLPPTGTWTPLCPDGSLAVAVPGSWHYDGEAGGGKSTSEPNILTFACATAAIAKCVTMQYKPWKSVPDARGPISVDTFHQACVRAVRADYCGNGESLTQAGMQVNFYDRLGLQRDTTDWPLEAVWSPDGALCINQTRLITAPANPRSGRAATSVMSYIKEHCAERLSNKPCDAAALAQKGGILWTEVPTTTPTTAPATAPAPVPTPAPAPTPATGVVPKPRS
jgi:hypothetical protein